MGYYTTYVLKLEPSTPEILKTRIPGSDLLLEDFFEEPMKWYEHESDLRTISEKFPDVLFVLDGRGESTGDVWRKYFKDGKVQTWKATFEPEAFDPEKLK